MEPCVSCIYISPIVWTMCENLNYESVYFKELHNKQEYYWATIYRAGADVVSIITSIKEDDKGNCDYQDDWDDWSGWDDQDHEIVMVTLVTRMTREGGIRWMSLWLGYLWWLGWQGWQLSKITRLTGMTRMRLITCQVTEQSVSYQFRWSRKSFWYLVCLKPLMQHCHPQLSLLMSSL